MQTSTRKLQIAFPTVATLRKGGAKIKKTNAQGRAYETVGPDLQDRFRVVFAPGAEDVAALWDAVYHTREPRRVRAMIPFPHVSQAWEHYNEAYNAGRMVARADDDHYLVLRDPLTGDYLVRDGEPYTKFEVGARVSYTRDGKTYELPVKSSGRLRLWLPEIGRMVTFELKTTSYYDCQNINAQLGAIQAVAGALNHGNAAGIPFYIYRKAQSVTWNKPDGPAQRVEKWLVQIEVDPEFVKAALQRMADFALTGSAAIGQLPSGEIAGAEDPDAPDDEDEVEVDYTEIPPDPEPVIEPPVQVRAPEPPPAEPAPASAGKTARPMPPETLREKLLAKADRYYAGRKANPDQVSLAAMLLTKCFAGQERPDKIRHSVQGYLTGFESLKDAPGPIVLALLDWLKPVQDTGGDYTPDEMAAREASSVWTASLKAAGQQEIPF